MAGTQILKGDYGILAKERAEQAVRVTRCRQFIPKFTMRPPGMARRLNDKSPRVRRVKPKILGIGATRDQLTTVSAGIWGRVKINIV